MSASDHTSLESRIAETHAALNRLSAVIGRESDLLGQGQITEGLGLTEEKLEATAAFERCLSMLKATLQDWPMQRPPSLQALMRDHALLEMKLAVNQSVLTTIRTVSEALLKDLSARVAAQSRPRTYGPPGSPSPLPQSAPVSLSRTS